MRKEKIILISLLLLGFILRLVNLNQSFWLDEAAQVIESSRPFFSQFHIPSDFHPPLYHVLLHYWMYLGNSEVWIRLFSVSLGIGSIILLYKLAKTLVTRQVALLAAFFLTLSPYHIWYSQEARPYILFVFLSLASTMLLLRKKWFLYALVTSLSLYSFYFAQFFVLGQFVYIYFDARKDIGRYLSSLIFAIVLFMPWLPSFFQQVTRGTADTIIGWTNVVSIATLKAIPLTFAKFIFGRGSIDNLFLYSIVILPEFILFIASLFLIYKKRDGQTIIILFFVPFATALTVSFFIPIVAPQRFIFLLPFFLLIIACGISQLPNLWKKIAILIFCLTSIFGIIHYYTSPYVQREQWRQAVNFVENQKDSQSIALFVFPEPFAPYLWYTKNKIQAIGIAPDFKINNDNLSNLGNLLEEKKRVYFFQYLTGLIDPNGITRQFIENHGFEETIIKDFPGVGLIYIYDKK